MVDEQKMFQDRKSLEKEEKKVLEEKEEPKPDKQLEKKEKEAAKEKEPVKKEKAKEAEKKDGKEDKEEIKKRVVVLERVYNVPLITSYRKTRYKRGDVAVKMLREYIARHMKSEAVKISTEVNNYIRQHGSGRPLKKVSVIAAKDKEGLTTVELKK